MAPITTGLQPSASPAAGASPSPAACPTAFAGVTHYVKAISIQLATDQTSYVRHACYNVYMTANYPVTDSVAAGDASQVMRMPADGFSGAVSIQSANFPSQFLAPLSDGYLFFDGYIDTVSAPAAAADEAGAAGAATVT